MYECNWCWNKRVHDDDKSFLRPDKDRMVTHMRFRCGHPDCKWTREWHPIMHPLIRNPDGDWVHEYNTNIAKTKENQQVTPGSGYLMD